jgi:hypothetical protein
MKGQRPYSLTGYGTEGGMVHSVQNVTEENAPGDLGTGYVCLTES